MEAVAIFLKSFQSLHEYNIHYSYWNWRFSFLNDYMGPSQIMLNTAPGTVPKFHHKLQSLLSRYIWCPFLDAQAHPCTQNIDIQLIWTTESGPQPQ